MEEPLNEILKKLTRIEESNNRLEKKIDKLQEELTETKKENKEIKEKVRRAEQKIEEQERRIQTLEREIRKKNIIIYGVKEEENETEQIRKEKIKEVLKKIEIPIDISKEIQQIYRMGKQEVIGGKSRPILVELTTEKKRADIFKDSKKLKGTDIWIAEDYSKMVQEIRKSLIPFLKDARNNGCKAIIRYDKLIVNGKMYSPEDLIQKTEEDETYSKKRGRTTSEWSPEGNDKAEQSRKITRMIDCSKN